MTTATLRTEMTAESRKLSGARVGIPARHMNFSYLKKVKHYFFGNSASVTLFLAELSSIFPPGERFFVESVRHYRDRVKDETLKAQVSGFIGQEAMHGREHERLNALLTERGIDTTVPEKAVTFALNLLENLPPSTQLACTAFMEHFTALLGEALLEDKEFIKRFDPEMLQMWQWHALEELEHKAVAYDVYEMVGNSANERRLAALLVILTVAPSIVFGWLWLMAQEGKLGDLDDIRDGVKALLGRGGFITRILKDIPDFFRTNHHPNERDTRELCQAWREKLFGEYGELNHALGNRKQLATA